MSDALTYSLDPRGVGTITLNRPEIHNAFDDALIAELTALLDKCAGDPNVRVLILTGAGRSFSAGADLSWMKRMAGYSREENLADAAALGRVMRALNNMPKPTIARVNGPAYGGGVGLVACCDVAIATKRASFCLSEVKLGLIPAVISPYVVSAIGARQARRYFQSAEVISAERALAFGLIHELVPDEELDAAIEGVLKAFFLGAPGAQANAKQLVFDVDAPLTDEIIAETGRRIANQRATDEGREGTTAFLSKRKPAWVAGGE